MDPHTTSKVRFIMNDVGGAHWEEISEGGTDFAGKDYGWPKREGPCERGKSNCSANPDFVEPIHWYSHGQEHNKRQTRAIVGSDFVPPNISPPWPEEFQKAYLYIEYFVGIFLLKPQGGNENRQNFPPTSNFQPIPLLYKYHSTRMKFGPDGKDGNQALYYLTRQGAGELRRVRYVGGNANNPPKSNLEVDLDRGGLGLTVTLDASQSTDPDGPDDSLTYSFDFGDGSATVNTNNVPTITYQYETSGTYDLKVTVEDKDGGRSSKSKEISVGIQQNKLAQFQWVSNDCAEGYDACGILEFCVNEEKSVFGYRTPCRTSFCDCLSGNSPVIRMEPGLRYNFILRNAAPPGTNPTNIHTHGLHLVGDGDGDDVTRMVKGEECLAYTWDISIDHAGGTYWYHPHFHGHSVEQVTGGAFGMLIIEDNAAFEGIPEWAKNELLLQISKIDGNVLGNGNVEEQIPVLSQQWYRLRVSVVDPLGVPNELVFQEGCTVHKVANDGVWRSKVPGLETRIFQLTGSSRADFAVHCSGSGSTIGIVYADVLVAELIVGDIETNPFNLQDWIPDRPASLQDTRSLVIPEENKFIVDISRDSINGLHWDSRIPQAVIAYGAVHEWSISDSIDHPFHLHLYHMQVVTPGGCGAHEEGEFYDTISGPPCLVRFRAIDFGQRCVFHCHVLSHEASGAMAWVDVQGDNMPINAVSAPSYTCDELGLEPEIPDCKELREIPFKVSALAFCGYLDLTSESLGDCDTGVSVDAKLSEVGGSCPYPCYIAFVERGEYLEYPFVMQENQNGVEVTISIGSFGSRNFELQLVEEGMMKAFTSKPFGYLDFREYTWRLESVAIGKHTLRLIMENGNFNVCSIEVRPLSTLVPDRAEIPSEFPLVSTEMATAPPSKFAATPGYPNAHPFSSGNIRKDGHVFLFSIAWIVVFCLGA